MGVLAAAIMGGAVIILMTWMEQGSESEVGRLGAEVAAAFLLAAGKLNHTIVVSLIVFAGLHAGLHALRGLARGLGLGQPWQPGGRRGLGHGAPIGPGGKRPAGRAEGRSRCR